MTDDTAPRTPFATNRPEPPVIDHDPPPQIPPSATEPPEAGPQRSVAPALSVMALLGVVILACAVAWLRQHPEPVDLGPQDARLAAIEQRIGAIEGRPAAQAPDMGPLETRIAALEQRKPPAPPAPPDLSPLEGRIAALEQRQPPPPPDLSPLDARIGALEQKAPPDLQPLDARIGALEHQAPPDLKPLDARIGALEQKPPPADTAARTGVAAAVARLDSVATRQDALAGRQEGLESSVGAKLDAADAKIADVAKAQAQTAAQVTGLGDKLSGQIAALNDKVGTQLAGVTDKLGGQISGLTEKVQTDDKRLASAEQGLNTLPGLAERATRLTRIQSAQQSLDNGQPVGAIDGAAPALAKFATAKPPTEAQLRLGFPAAASAASAASQPPVADKPFLERAWAKAQTLVTVRQGDHVLVGDPAAGILAHARSALDSGDLQGAADTVGTLGGPAADAMAGWLSQARDLLAARAALAALAAHG